MTKTSTDLTASEIVRHGPDHIWIEPTSRCNTRCIHCGHHYSVFGEDMPEDLFQSIMSQSLGDVKSVELIGYGEPLLAPHFDQMLDECVARGIHVIFVTNGILLHDEERLARLVRLPITICLSIEGACAETHEFLRPYIKWQKITELLESINRHRIEAGKESRFAFRFNFVAVKKNIADLPQVVELAHRYGADLIQLLPLGGEDIFEKVKGQSLHDSPDLVVPPLSQAIALAKRYGVVMDVPDSFTQMLINWPSGRNPIRFLRRNMHRVMLLAGYLKTKGMGQVVNRVRQADKTAYHSLPCFLPLPS